ncbi:unnamed protein product, partial [Brassica rapa]
MSCVLNLPGQPPIYYTAVYASNLSSERVDLWADLLNLHDTLDFEVKNRIIDSDFNQIIYPNEQSNPGSTTPDSLMYQLQDCFLQLGVFDLRYLGPYHSWTNNQPENPTAKKLDRLLINSNIISTFPHCLATFLPLSLISDHSPCFLDLAYQLPKAGTKPYKFQNYLTKHPSFAQV